VERELELVVGIWWPVRSIVTAMPQHPKRAAAPLAQPLRVKPRITTDLDKVLTTIKKIIDSVDKHIEKFAAEIDAEEKVEEEEIREGDIEELIDFVEELELGNNDTSAAAQNK